MRTTVTLDDDVYEFVHMYSRAKEITLGAAIGELIRRGQAAPPPSPMDGLTREANGMVVFASRPGRVITSEMVKRYQEDEVG